MKAAFDSEQFEKLSGMALGRYVVEFSKEGELPVNFFDYFKSNVGRWDGQHLEMALSLLRKIDTNAAKHEIANHLIHPLKYIRLTTLSFIDQFDAIDGYVLSKIEESLQCATEEFELQWLKQLQKKATKS